MELLGLLAKQEAVSLSFVLNGRIEVYLALEEGDSERREDRFRVQSKAPNQLNSVAGSFRDYGRVDCHYDAANQVCLCTSRLGEHSNTSIRWHTVTIIHRVLDRWCATPRFDVTQLRHRLFKKKCQREFLRIAADDKFARSELLHRIIGVQAVDDLEVDGDRFGSLRIDRERAG